MSGKINSCEMKITSVAKSASISSSEMLQVYLSFDKLMIRFGQGDKYISRISNKTAPPLRITVTACQGLPTVMMLGCLVFPSPTSASSGGQPHRLAPLTLLQLLMALRFVEALIRGAIATAQPTAPLLLGLVESKTVSLISMSPK